MLISMKEVTLEFDERTWARLCGAAAHCAISVNEYVTRVMRVAVEIEPCAGHVPELRARLAQSGLIGREALG